MVNAQYIKRLPNQEIKLVFSPSSEEIPKDIKKTYKINKQSLTHQEITNTNRIFYLRGHIVYQTN